MKTFFRLEGSAGHGIYASGYNEILGELCGNNEHSPSPHQDLGLMSACRVKNLPIMKLVFSGDWRFGFTSKKMMTDWFNLEVINKLLNAGARLIMVEQVSSCYLIEGDKQVVIDSNFYSGTLKKNISFEEFVAYVDKA